MKYHSAGELNVAQFGTLELPVQYCVKTSLSNSPLKKTAENAAVQSAQDVPSDRPSRSLLSDL